MSNFLGDYDSILYLNNSSLFLSNGKEGQNVPLKDLTKTKMGCQECRGG